jgi:hypothetical protein
MRLPALALLLLCLFSAAASAQTYRCSANGRIYYSDRPCTEDAKLQSYGPTDNRVARVTLPSSGQAAPRAEEHLKYLSSECAAISEAIRTAPARGVRYQDVNALRRDYDSKCAFEDRDARAKVSNDRQREYQQHQARKEAEARDQKQAMAQRERCDGMRDVIAVRRKRESQLDAHDLESLHSLQKTYNEVCLKG